MRAWKAFSSAASDHVRAHVVGYLALFFVFTGGAYALPGRDSVDSADIKNGEVSSVDVRDDDLPGGGLGAVDLRVGSVAGSEVRRNALGTADVNETTLFNDDSLTGADVNESSLDLPDVLHAVVDVGGGPGFPVSLHASRGATSVSRQSTGVYLVTFDRPVPQSECSATGTLTQFGTVGAGAGEISVEHALSGDAIRVKTFDSGGVAANDDFTLTVAC